MPNIELHLLQIFALLDNVSENNYLVGGCVRDAIMCVQNKDFDIVTDIHMDTLAQMFESNNWHVKDTGKAFLVLSIAKDGEQYEIANFRKDGVYSDGRRPDTVNIGTMAEDAMRRDFTINALYLNPRSKDLKDPTGMGEKDLATRTLRFIGRPADRIKEDYLRVFRFYRFVAKGFVPDPRSLSAVRELFKEAYEKTTPERARVELERMAHL